jgi:hypothetical protein
VDKESDQRREHDDHGRPGRTKHLTVDNDLIKVPSAKAGGPVTPTTANARIEAAGRAAPPSRFRMDADWVWI